jgi:hypothetical protein
MNLFIRAAVFAACIGASIVAFADIDYERIKKDVTVMTQILKSAFAAEDKRMRGVRIEGIYLAEQGAVFKIQAPRALSGYSFRFEDGDGEYEFISDDEVFINVPMIVSEALSNVAITLEGMSSLEDLEDLEQLEELRELERHEVHRQDRETRAAVRDIAREAREIEREISEYRIELIHAEDDEKREINKTIADLDKRLVETEKKQEELEKVLTQRVKIVKERRVALREKALEAQKEQFKKVEGTIMQALCDYGTTLRYLPDDEHISVVLEQVPSSDDRQIFVFDKDEVTDCRSGSDKLAEKSTRYVF